VKTKPNNTFVSAAASRSTNHCIAYRVPTETS